MIETNAPARPLVAWMDVLDHIDESLGHSLAETPEPAPASEVAEAAGSPLARFDERLEAWQSSLEKVERQATTSNERMDAEHAALAEWLEKLTQVRDRVTRWVEACPRP